MTTGLPFWMCGLNNDTIINILVKVESIITQNSTTCTELEDCMHEYLQLWMSDVFNDNSLRFWMSRLNNDTIINILDKEESIITQNSITCTELEDCMHEYLRLWMSDVFNDNSLRFWMSRLNNDTIINILDKVESIITQSTITFTELEDCRHEYLRLWMSGFFNDQRFTILNKWSQQWSLYQNSRQSGVNNNSKFFNIYWVRGLQARISTIMNEWCLQWQQVYHFEWVD